MSDPAGPIAALRASHDRLSAVVSALEPEQHSGRAYPSEWSIGQVLSHLGSGAEIIGLTLDAVIAGEEPPSRELYGPIWDRWNAKDPATQVADGLDSDELLVRRLEALTPAQRETLRPVSYMGEVDIDGFVRLRLNEHAVHTWDVEVAVDPSATIGAETVGFVVGGLGLIARWTGKPGGRSQVVRVDTTDPDGVYTLTLADSVTLAAGDDAAGDDDAAGADGAAGARVQLPAEALIRLLYGRLDPDHTPPTVRAEGITLDDLRSVFPGL